MKIDVPNNCRKEFKNNQGYGLHKVNCRKNETGSNLANVMKHTSLFKNVELIVKNTVSDMVNQV